MIPEDFQRGVVYTVDPRVLAPLVPGEQYRIVASTRFLVAGDQAFTEYDVLYRRARRLVETRRDELICAAQESRVHTWIVSHGWFRMEISVGALVGAVVTLGAACLSTTDAGPQGEPDPAAEALRSPFVTQLGAAGVTSYDEFYNDFDMRRERTRGAVLTVSYGEYVPSRDSTLAASSHGPSIARAYTWMWSPPAESSYRLLAASGTALIPASPRSRSSPTSNCSSRPQVSPASAAPRCLRPALPPGRAVNRA